MATYTRASAWNNSGNFNNQDLLWYAKGVGAMQARTIDKSSSWWFFEAIHGEYVTQQSMGRRGAFPWKNIPLPPQVGVTCAAAIHRPGAIAQYWDQCQHQTWFFPPWHRGYLLALEAQIRADIVALGGPSTWALPYWNYFGPANQFEIPPAFTQPKLPDGSPNPLNVEARYGPDGDQNIYVPTPAGIAAHPGDPNFAFGPVTQDVMTNTVYTGKDSHTKLPGFGGPETKFWHGGGTSGNLESNPHNVVHSYVGGSSPDGSIPGSMTCSFPLWPRSTRSSIFTMRTSIGCGRCGTTPAIRTRTTPGGRVDL